VGVDAGRTAGVDGAGLTDRQRAADDTGYRIDRQSGRKSGRGVRDGLPLRRGGAETNRDLIAFLRFAIDALVGPDRRLRGFGERRERHSRDERKKTSRYETPHAWGHGSHRDPDHLVLWNSNVAIIAQRPLVSLESFCVLKLSPLQGEQRANISARP